VLRSSDFALAIYTGINYFFSIIIIRYRFTQLQQVTHLKREQNKCLERWYYYEKAITINPANYSYVHSHTSFRLTK